MLSPMRPAPDVPAESFRRHSSPGRGSLHCSTVEHLHLELRLQDVPHEIVVVDDGSTDRTWEILSDLQPRFPTVAPMQNTGAAWLRASDDPWSEHMTGDAVVIMMADESDDCRDVVRYWQSAERGIGLRVWKSLCRRRRVDRLSAVQADPEPACRTSSSGSCFGIPLNDTTNAFKAYRRTVIEGCRPFIAPHFNLTVELPLKAIVRGYSWTVIPITWRNRRTGEAKLKIKEMGSRYFFIFSTCGWKNISAAATTGNR